MGRYSFPWCVGFCRLEKAIKYSRTISYFHPYVNPQSTTFEHSSMTTGLTVQPQKLAVFIDYWNFQLSCNTYDLSIGGQGRFDVDWQKLNHWTSQHVAAALNRNLPEIQHTVTHIYTSYNPATAAEKKYKKWVDNFLNIQSGIIVTCLERRKKGDIKCASCNGKILDCPHCKASMNATEEKGVDTRLSVQMLDLAVNGAYDVAALMSHDADMAPAVDFVQARGKLVFHFGFTPNGASLRKACNHNFDMRQDIESIRRQTKT